MRKTSLDPSRPPKDVFKIKHPPEYIHTGSDRYATRRIYFRVPFDEFEEKKIIELQRLLASKEIQVPHTFLYASKFELYKKDGCVERIQQHLKFLKSQSIQPLTTEAESILKLGLVYQYGYDKQYRPIIIFSLEKLAHNEHKLIDLENSIATLLEHIRRYSFVPGIVENWIVIIEANNMKFEESQLETLDALIEVFHTNFPETLEKIFIFDAPEGAQDAWKTMKTMIPETIVKKINFVTAENRELFDQYVDKSQLESRFCGSLPNLSENFWPPQNVTQDEDDAISQEFGMHSHTDFTSFPSSEETSPAARLSDSRIECFTKNELSLNEMSTDAGSPLKTSKNSGLLDSPKSKVSAKPLDLDLEEKLLFSKIKSKESTSRNASVLFELKKEAKPFDLELEEKLVFSKIKRKASANTTNDSVSESQFNANQLIYDILFAKMSEGQKTQLKLINDDDEESEKEDRDGFFCGICKPKTKMKRSGK